MKIPYYIFPSINLILATTNTYMVVDYFYDITWLMCIGPATLVMALTSSLHYEKKAITEKESWVVQGVSRLMWMMTGLCIIVIWRLFV